MDDKYSASNSMFECEERKLTPKSDFQYLMPRFFFVIIILLSTLLWPRLQPEPKIPEDGAQQLQSATPTANMDDENG